VTALQHADQVPRMLWARRSQFGFGSQSVLVSEVFSPRLLQFDEYNDRSGGTSHP
jgi:chorismate-pyruvate lyase